MKMKKIWLSYPLWLAFTAAAGIMLAVYLSAIGNLLWETDKYTTPVLICLVFAAVVGIWFLGYKMAGTLQGRFLQEEHSRKMTECFLVMSLFAAASLYRIYLLKFWDMPQDLSYYHMALIKNSGGVPEIAHGASYVYMLVLSALLSLIGNKEIAGLFLQIVFQMFSLIFLYFGVKLLTGRVEALCVMAVMSFLPAYGGQIYCITPDTFCFFLFTTGIWGAGLCSRTIGKQKKTADTAFFVMGLYIGLLGFLDGAGLLLLFFAGCLVLKDGMQGKDGYRGGCRKFLLLFLGTIAAMSGLMALDAGLSGSTLKSIWNTWFAMFTGNGGLVFPSVPGKDLAAGLILCFCAALGAVGFWFHGKQKQDAWIFFLLAVTIMDMASVGPLGYDIFIAFGWSILAGIGITSMGTYGEEERLKNENLQSQVCVCAASANLRCPKSSLKMKEKMMKHENFQPQAGAHKPRLFKRTKRAHMNGKARLADMPELILEDMDDVAEIEGREEPEEGKTKVKLIENPLPLPKKHVRREMDFDRIVEWDKMKFDIAVDDADDFDI